MAVPVRKEIANIPYDRKLWEKVLMNTSSETRHPAKKNISRHEGIAFFWQFSSHQGLLTDSERLRQIKAGFPADLIQTFRLAFDLQDSHLETLLNASISTLERRRRECKNLDSVASERLDRIAWISHLAARILDTQLAATLWMSASNNALGGYTPVMLCETEIGAKRVRRILQAIEWGGVA
jgi:putative toxin-antitoxin system antitoxin component (TIGR02293 family)